MADTIKISLELADKAAQQSLSDFINKADKADKGFKKLGDSGKNSFNEITVGIGKSIGVYDIFAGNVAANVVTGAFNLMKGAASELFQTFIVDGVKAAQESEDALNSLNVALGQAGQYSEAASEKFQNFAKEIQRTTAFEDDAVIKNAALIQSMAGLSESGLERATQAAIELSAALGKDLATTSEAIGKAANGNVTSLQKMGIQFEKAGTQAGTFENALEAIESRFGGSAASKLNTFSGAIEQSKNAFGDLQEEIGGLIITNPAVIASLTQISNILRISSGNIASNKEGFQVLIAQGLITFIDVTKLVVQAANIMATGVSVSFNSVVAVVARTMQVLHAPLAGLVEADRKAWTEYKRLADDATKSVANSVNNEGDLGGAVKHLDAIGKSAQTAFDKMKSGADASVPSIKNSQNALRQLSDEEIKANEATNKYVESLATRNESIKANYDLQLQDLRSFYEEKDAIDIESDVINYEQKLIREQNFYADRQALLDEQVSSELQRINESTVAESTKASARLAVQNKYYADSSKLQTDYAKKSAQLEEAKDKQLIDNQKSTFATISTLSQSNNVNLANIGKAAGIAQIAIDTPVAISKALAAAPPPFNFALAALVGTAMAAQAARIAGLSFEQGGIVPGASFSGDRVQANVNSGEMILNRQQQSNLFKMANGDGAGSSSYLSDKVDALITMVSNVLSQPMVVNIDGRELFNVTREQLASGRSF